MALRTDVGHPSRRSAEIISSGPAGSTDGAFDSSRIAPLDGLRAIAILLVIAHNAGSVDGALSSIPLKAWALVSNAGWAGVQIFFTLSGFLITRILLNSQGSNGWLRTFYVRRVLRIFPLYYALLAMVFLAAPFIPMLRPLHTGGTRSALWFVAYLSNWATPFGNLPANLPHLWSLAVEEQIYLVWPLIIALFDESILSMLFGGMVVVALIVRVALHALFTTAIADTAAYTFTVARWDAIALGALVAIVMNHPRVRAFVSRHFAVLFGAPAVVLMAVTLWNRGLPPEGTVAEVAGQPLVGVLSALIVFFCVSDRSKAGAANGWLSWLPRLLSTPALRVIGKYSYAIYVFQTPVHLLLISHERPWITSGSDTQRFVAHVAYTVSVFAISFALAIVSWHTIEQPFLSLKRFFPTRAGKRVRAALEVPAMGEPARLP